MRRRPLAATVLLALAGAASAQEEALPRFTPIEIVARPIVHFEVRSTETEFGEVEYRGGFDLSSPYEDFASLSGLDITPDSRLLAVADTGYWLTARLLEEDGRLVGLADAAMAPIVGDDGAPPDGKGDADAEGLRIVSDDTGPVAALVSFEQRHRIRRFELAALPAAAPTEIRLASTRGLRGNRGIEALAVSPVDGPLAGGIVTISERADDGHGGIRAWVQDGPRRGAFSIRRLDRFEITDAAFDPTGTLFILERRFSMADGIAMRIRRIEADDIRPGAMVEGTTVLSADLGFHIDNMEGLAVRVTPAGETLLTVVSDDNHSLLQRTLLLQFAWHRPGPPLPRTRPQS